MSGPVDEREVRVGLNEAVLRAVNDQMLELGKTFVLASEEFAIVCECGQLKCVEQIQITRGTYARVRADPTLFLLVPGHDDPTVEAVVETDQEAYVVVRKPRGTPAESAANVAPGYPDRLEHVRRDAVDSIAKQMRENGMSSREDFEDVHQTMLPDHGRDFLASGPMSITWRDVKKRLEEN